MKKIVVGPLVWENNYFTLRILLFFFSSLIHITFKVVDDIKVAFISNILISWSANFITSGSPYKTNSLLHCVTNLSHCVVNCGCLPFDLKLLENRVGKKIINDFSNFRERQNISKCVLFFWSECSKQKFVFRFFKPSLIPVSALCSLFSVNRICFGDPDRFAHVNGKQLVIDKIPWLFTDPAAKRK